MLRLNSDLFLDSEQVYLQKVGYYDGECSNEIVFKKIKSNLSLDQIFLGETLLLNRNQQLWDLDSSPCANYLGASTLAVTSDGYLIIGRQGDSTRINVGRYAPSGSGSVDYKDQRGKTDFFKVLIKAMEREFYEENNYRITERDSTKTLVLGYVRLIERGGKPDFFGITFLPEKANMLKKKIKWRELGLQKESLFLKIIPEKGIAKTLLDFCEQKDKTEISIQLRIIAELLEKYETEIPENPFLN